MELWRPLAFGLLILSTFICGVGLALALKTKQVMFFFFILMALMVFAWAVDVVLEKSFYEKVLYPEFLNGFSANYTCFPKGSFSLGYEPGQLRPPTGCSNWPVAINISSFNQSD